MGRTIGRNGAVAVLAAALVVSGLFVGVSYGSGGGITDPQVIELTTVGCTTDDSDPATECSVYRLEDTEGQRSGSVVRFRVPVWDVDGTQVGRAFLECVTSTGAGSVCTNVLSLKEGPYTDLGTIVSTGIGLPPRAITGGSGAYLNVRGEMTGATVGGDFVLTLNLIP